MSDVTPANLRWALNNAREERRELLHIATVTEPDFMWTFRTPRANVTPLVRAGYVIEHPTAKDMYRVTREGMEALEKEQAS